MSVIKHREGAHENTIREFRLTKEGVRIGAPLRHFRGVLTGVPVYGGEGSALFDEDE